MQNQSMETLIQRIVAALEKENRKVLFLISESDQEEGLFLKELNRLLDRYPDSRICMDLMPEDTYPAIQNDSRCRAKLLQSRKDIRQEVLLADNISAVSLNLSALRKISLGIGDSNVTFACMEALLHGKQIVAADDDYKNRLNHSGAVYRSMFEEAKSRTEQYGIVFCGLHEIRPALDTKDIRTENMRISTSESRSGKKQLVTIEELAKHKDMVIEEDAIITPAAKELLIGKNSEKAEE